MKDIRNLIELNKQSKESLKGINVSVNLRLKAKIIINIILN